MRCGQRLWSRCPRERRTAPWPEDALTGSVLRPRSFSATYARVIQHQTHYDTLGVHTDATAAEIRAAYLRRAREVHPDVRRATDAASGRASMSDLNRAYHVLGREVTRREYDRSLRDDRAVAGATDDRAAVDESDSTEFDPRSTSPGSRTIARALTPSGPPRMPWKLMGVAALVGTVAVLASAAFADPPSEETPDGILRVGSCVTVEPNGDVREIACTGDGDRVVALLIPTGATCPPAYATHRDRLGLGTVCVEPTA